VKIPARLLNHLDAAGLRYEILHHPVAYTAQELAAIEGVKGREHAKVVMIQLAGELVMLVLPADHRIDWARLGAPATLAPEDVFRPAFPDCETGTMPPLGALYGVRMLVDRRLAENDRIAFEAGTHSDAIVMTYADYARLAQPVLADFAVKPT
jgi:Ala-tRNA(Pro) deacylase